MEGMREQSKPNKSSKVLFKFDKQFKMPLGFGVLPFCLSVRFLFCLLTREPCWWLVVVMTLFLGGLCDLFLVFSFLLAVGCVMRQGLEATGLLVLGVFAADVCLAGGWCYGLVCDFSIGWSADGSQFSFSWCVVVRVFHVVSQRWF
ncbi:hypothetical protein Pint_27262 [Pistacia integerrima]|uniref:Uncharacterized protein n=1 Tax=Pistacia integerrima TaxID=434235 RepID=A0ACC0YVN5_9ROSI|nr:hypothetical protein Pint_27262 [Pistacia integerrima]